MSDMLKTLIIWSPTILFILILLFGFIVGLVRGLRKSIIMFIHTVVAATICFIVYIIIVNNKNLDVSMVSFINSILKNFNTSLQATLEVSESCTALTEMLVEKIVSSMSAEELASIVIKGDMPYIYSMVEMAYRIVLGILCWILYFFIKGLLYLIYLIFYPLRRKIKKHNRKFRDGEVPTPYKRRRLLGGVVGTVRSLLVGIVAFSFLGTLIFLVTGGSKIPNRDKLGNGDGITFENNTFNEAYDYYSMVCAMGDTGIFQVLNGMKDSKNTPYYFYFADLVLQGRINDPELGIDDKFYLRDEVGYYIDFVKKTLTLVLEYSDSDLANKLISGKMEDADTYKLLDVMANPDFNAKFKKLIEEFEAKPYVINLCLSSLTTVVNHIDSVTEDKTIVNLVKCLFVGDDAIKVTDLATEDDVKNLFNGVISLIAEAKDDIKEGMQDENADVTKLSIKHASSLVHTIKALSLFNNRKDKGNKLICNLYKFCTENLIEEDFDLPEIPSDMDWINEFNILLDATDPLLKIAGNIYDKDSNKMVLNFTTMFEDDNASENSINYDELSKCLVKSSLLDVVFKSSMVGKTVRDLVVNLTENEEAKIPLNKIAFTGEDGECAILLASLKAFLLNGGGQIYNDITDETKELDGEMLSNIIKILTKKLDDNKTLIDILLESKLLYYVLSSYLVYGNISGIDLYISNTVLDAIQDGEEVYPVVKQEEIVTLVNAVVDCSDLVIKLISSEDEEVDYSAILTDDSLLNAMSKSIILKGTIANVIISNVSSVEQVVLPYGYDSAETWLSLENPNDEKSKCEIDHLIDAIHELISGSSDEDESFVNSLLSGNVKPKTFINLADTVVQTLCSSKVLLYTISNMMGSIGDSSFAIVVPYRSIAEHNAKTTTEKCVDVIKKEEITNTFNEIKGIINFDEEDNISVDYKTVFANKDELLNSDTIHATLINLIIKLDEDLVIPNSYIEDFEKIKTTDSLENNAWYGATTKDYEIYLLLDAFESMIKKENGEIPDNFDITEINSNIYFTKQSVDAICSSVILDATISNFMVDTLSVPVNIYNAEMQSIDSVELKKVFDVLFDLLGEDELTLNDFSSFEFDQVKLSHTVANKIPDSTILSATVSQYVLKTDDIFVPNTQVNTNVKLVKTEENISVLKQVELNNLLDALFIVCADENDNIDINAIDTDNISIRRSEVDDLLKSETIKATISNKVMENEGIVVPNDSVHNTTFVGGNTGYVIVNTASNQEFSILMKSLVDMFGKKESNSSDRVLSLSEIDTDKMKLPRSVKEEMSNSNILNATLSYHMLNMKLEDLYIPMIVTEKIDVVTSTEKEMVILKTELSAYLDALFTLFAEDDVLDVENIRPSEIKLTDSNVDEILVSQIISSTISENVLAVNGLVVSNNIVKPATYIDNTKGNNIENNNTKELSALLKAFVGMFGTENSETHVIEVKVDDVDASSIKLNSAMKTRIMASSIMIATISNNIIEAEAGLSIPSDTVLNVNTVSNESKSSLKSDEFAKLLDVMFVLFADVNGVVDVDNIDSDNIIIKKDEITGENAITKSLIIQATISEKITAVDDVVVLKEVTNPMDLYKGSARDIIKNVELEAMFNAMFALIGQDVLAVKNLQSSFDNLAFKRDKMTIVLNSNIMSSTISKQLLEADALVKPNNIKKDFTLANSENQNQTIIVNDEVDKLFNALFVTTSGEIKVKNFALESLTLPDTNSNASEMVDSIIIAATISKQVINAGESIVVIPDKVLEKYTYESISTTEKYIEKTELANLIVAFNKGLNINNASDLSIKSIAVPKTSEEQDNLLASEIVKLTISKMVMNQENIRVCDSVTKVSVNGVMVVELSPDEIKALINGINTLGSGSFEEIVLTQDDIIKLISDPDKTTKLATIGASEIYRGILTILLSMPYHYNTLYELLLTDDSSHILTIGGQQQNYNYASSAIFAGKYTINFPTTTTEVYVDFEGNTSQELLVAEADVIALNYVSAPSI